MHEVSLVRSLISQAIQAAEPVTPAGIRTIRVIVGPLTGMEPALVQQAFDALKDSASLTDCQLAIDEQRLEAMCLDCEQKFIVNNFVFYCPRCASPRVRITQGDDFRLVSIDVDDEVRAESQSHSVGVIARLGKNVP